MNNNKEIYCGNCGKEGHIYRRCLSPIMSLGIVLYKIKDSKLYYLLVQRRDTLGFVEFMRGKYNIENLKYINELFEIMTGQERLNILTYSFDVLWENLWMNKNLNKFHNEYNNSKKKFNKLKMGIIIDNIIISLETIHKSIPIIYHEAEWGFPKGRRNLKESDIECAKREFMEETGYREEHYKLDMGIEPVSEIFSGTNNIRYMHMYYIAESLYDKILTINKDDFNQVSEISHLDWFLFEDAKQSFRPYNNEKADVLVKINDILLK